MSARVLMIQGTSSSAGKSVLTAAFCRIFARRGLKVAPFKAQNMSNNAGVCLDGSEIGRAQYVQAIACGIEPNADMNPILLKPEADARSQIVVLGKVWKTLPARLYYQHKSELWQIVTAALDRLRAAYDLVIIEGAGSPVELNLRAGDIVNMAVARYACSPVLLVGDIDRGGIFAQLLGTFWLLPSEEQHLVRGFLVNKFRGDPTLFADGVRILEEKSGIPVLGVIPYIHNIGVSEEDAVALDVASAASIFHGIDIAVIRLPHIANFDDFDPLAGEQGVRVRYVSSLSRLGQPHAIIIPGTKSTIADLQWLQASGLAKAILQAASMGTAVVGICGGYQMLGEAIHDPYHVESAIDETQGLGLLPVQTTFASDKATHQVHAVVNGGQGWLTSYQGQTIEGYEIHMGQTEGGTPWLLLIERNGQPVRVTDGSVSANGQIWGCYLHGIFENTAFRRAWLASLGWKEDMDMPPGHCLLSSLERLADVVEQAVDMKRLEQIWES